MKTNSLIELNCVEVSNVSGGDLITTFMIGVFAKPIDYWVHSKLPQGDNDTWEGWLWNGAAKGISFVAGMFPYELYMYMRERHLDRRVKTD